MTNATGLPRQALHSSQRQVLWKMRQSWQTISLTQTLTCLCEALPGLRQTSGFSVSSPGKAIRVILNAHRAYLPQSGVKEAGRLTLADANSRRSDAVFTAVAQLLMGQVSRHVCKRTQKLLYLSDSTSIILKGCHFDEWTWHNRTSRTQGIKLHVLRNPRF